MHRRHGELGPEDWPIVLHQFSLVLEPGGWAYLTVELPEEDVLTDDTESAPLVPGEALEGGGYHYYPDAERVRGWLQRHDLSARAEAEGHGYLHFLAERE